MHLIPNVYKFTCSCDTIIIYIGMTTRHSGVRVYMYNEMYKVHVPNKAR